MKNLKPPIKYMEVEKSIIQIRRITYAGKFSCSKCNKRSGFIRQILIFRIEHTWLCPQCYYRYIKTLIKNKFY